MQFAIVLPQLQVGRVACPIRDWCLASIMANAKACNFNGCKVRQTAQERHSVRGVDWQSEMAANVLAIIRSSQKGATNWEGETVGRRHSKRMRESCQGREARTESCHQSQTELEFPTSKCFLWTFKTNAAKIYSRHKISNSNNNNNQRRKKNKVLCGVNCRWQLGAFCCRHSMHSPSPHHPPSSSATTQPWPVCLAIALNSPKTKIVQ